MQLLAMASCASVMPSRSSLNPNAPMFIPAAFFAAEDFSPEWWHLVHTCPAFREYWLSECFDPDQQQMQDFSEDLDLFGEDAFFTDLELVFLDAYQSVLFKQEESLPPFPSLDVREFARKAGLNELSISPKHSRRQFSPLAYYIKPPKVVAAARPQKLVLRKIQQPR